MAGQRSSWLRLCNLLIEGPRSVHWAGERGHQYLEVCASAVQRAYRGGTWRSWHIFCDACGHDESGYLTPMVRFAEWQKSPAPSLQEWPPVRVQLAQFPPDAADLHAVIRELQAELARLPFPLRNLPVRRDFGDDDDAPEWGLGTMTVSVSSGYQTLERHLFVDEAPGLAARVAEVEQCLRRLAMPVVRD